jgi:hypothetical protein
MEYTMKLHENKSLFIQLFNFAANTLNIRAEFVEKDYWLTRALQRMAQNQNTANKNKKERLQNIQLNLNTCAYPPPIP